MGRFSTHKSSHERKVWLGKLCYVHDVVKEKMFVLRKPIWRAGLLLDGHASHSSGPDMLN
jgi:hypothetical protein